MLCEYCTAAHGWRGGPRNPPLQIDALHSMKGSAAAHLGSGGVCKLRHVGLQKPLWGCGGWRGRQRVKVCKSWGSCLGHSSWCFSLSPWHELMGLPPARKGGGGEIAAVSCGQIPLVSSYGSLRRKDQVSKAEVEWYLSLSCSYMLSVCSLWYQLSWFPSDRTPAFPLKTRVLGQGSIAWPGSQS